MHCSLVGIGGVSSCTVIRTLMCRAETISSSGVSWIRAEEHEQQLLQKNGYPVAFITRHSLPQPVPRNEEHTAQASVTIPYMHGMLQSIRRLLSLLAIKVTFRHFYIFTSLYFPPFVLHPLCHVTSHHLSAPVFIQRPLYYYY